MTDLTNGGEEPSKEEIKPFVAPCNDLAPVDTFKWLKAGWGDYRAALGLSLVWGLFFFLLSIGVALTAWKAGGLAWLIGLVSSFVFVAPLLAFAMYAISRKVCMGAQPTLMNTLRAIKRPIANSMVFALALLVLCLLWARAASMVHIFFPATGSARFEDLVLYLGIGSAVGAVFAAIAFTASVFSLPFIANRDVDVITAIVSSVNAVLRNRWTMALWAVMVATLTAVGFLTAMVGFIVIIPWLGYATWHAYRAALQVDDWDTLPAGN
ncbi:MAG: DUF2189 domain-containing protein [Gammaproteobacteria bacterium]|nr:DUF2189 domain-containing protein [Gammaproteobacteria bacterium]NNJ79801.1 DUF2189 domain-containing protein [Xanthomonadales bacterium]